MGVIQFANGVRGLLECGTLAPHVMPGEDFWLDGAVTVYGSHGYVRAGIGSGWQALTVASGDSCSLARDLRPQEPRFYRDLADWLDDAQRVHPCHGDISYHGFELLIGMGLSSVERRQIDIPITPIPTTPELTRLEKVLKVLLTARTPVDTSQFFGHKDAIGVCNIVYKRWTIFKPKTGIQGTRIKKIHGTRFETHPGVATLLASSSRCWSSCFATPLRR